VRTPHPASLLCEPEQVDGHDPVSGEITDTLDRTWSAQQRLPKIKTANIYLRVAGSCFWTTSIALVIALAASLSLRLRAGGGVSTQAMVSRRLIGEADGTGHRARS